MNRSRVGWLVPTVLVLIGLCYLVPFTVLRDVDAWYGSFLFWTVVSALVIGINAIVSSAWRD